MSTLKRIFQSHHDHVVIREYGVCDLLMMLEAHGPSWCWRCADLQSAKWLKLKLGLKLCEYHVGWWLQKSLSSVFHTSVLHEVIKPIIKLRFSRVFLIILFPFQILQCPLPLSLSLPQRRRRRKTVCKQTKTFWNLALLLFCFLF